MYNLKFATDDERHLMTKMRRFEDKILMSKCMSDVEELRRIVYNMNMELQKMQYARMNRV